MDLDIPVFDTKSVKRSFYYFFVFNALLTLAITVATIAFDISFQSFLIKVDTWMLFLLLYAGTYFFSAKSKKELTAIVETTDLMQKFSRYERYYKQKLIWNAFSLITTGLVLILTSKHYFLYLLFLQLALSLLFYPSKKTLSKELQVEGIVFT